MLDRLHCPHRQLRFRVEIHVSELFGELIAIHKVLHQLSQVRIPACRPVLVGKGLFCPILLRPVRDDQADLPVDGNSALADEGGRVRRGEGGEGVAFALAIALPCQHHLLQVELLRQNVLESALDHVLVGLPGEVFDTNLPVFHGRLVVGGGDGPPNRWICLTLRGWPTCLARNVVSCMRVIPVVLAVPAALARIVPSLGIFPVRCGLRAPAAAEGEALLGPLLALNLAPLILLEILTVHNHDADEQALKAM
mmetsp:Transcript_54707/g.127625  ORF Transcript_54707/g.127625 Transcript_54707/m.127625 type:complete len:252 (-) Transcript_54707:13-768(-)